MMYAKHLYFILIGLLFEKYIIASATPNLHSYYNDIIDEVNSGGNLWQAGHNFDVESLPSLYNNLVGSLIDEKSNENNHADETEDEADDEPYDESESDEVDKHETITCDCCSNTANSAEEGEIGRTPKEFDGRVKWKHCPSVNHIWDQGNCASDWVIGPVSAIADRLCLATNASYKHLLSPQLPLACCKDCGWGCKKGYPYQVWKYWAKKGLVTGGDYKSRQGCQPYSVKPCSHYVDGKLPRCSNKATTPRCRKHCYNGKYNTPFKKDITKGKKISGYGCACCVTSDIYKNGPVTASFLVYEDFLHYKSGIYHHVTGKRIGMLTVRILGWGEEGDTRYWIAANSWNKNWGDNGFFKIRRGVDECMFEGHIVSGIPKIKKD